MEKKLRIAVIGTGGMGINHVRWWAENPRAEVVAALARGEDAAALRKRIYEAYLKAEDAGQLEVSAKYNAILNEWSFLTEEVSR